MGKPAAETAPLTALTIQHEGTAWPLWKSDDSEPYIRDLDWAERLGFERPRTIRDLIKRMTEAGQLGNVVCRTVRQTPGSVGGRPATEFLLTEGQALKVAAKSETKNADSMLDTLIAVFMKARSGAQPGHRVAIDDPVNTIKALLGSMKTAQDEARADRLEFFAEMRAGREERKTTLGLMLKMTRMLRAAPSVATTSRVVKAQKTRPAQNGRERYGYQVDVALRLGMSRSSLSKFIERHPALRELQRKDGRWPVAKTVAAVKEIREKAETATHTVPVQPIATAEQLPLAPAKKPDRIYSPERLDLVKHMNVHALRNQRTETDQRSDDWQALYRRFKEWSHYNPYELPEGKKQALDLVEARGHMGALLSVAQKLFPLPDQHAHAC